MSSASQTQFKNPFSDGADSFSFGVIITTVISAVISFGFYLVRKAFKTAKDGVLNYIKQKVRKFFNWDEPSTHQLNTNPNPNAHQYDIISCCICLENISLPVMSACNHPFCGGCIIRLWESKNKKKLSCPYCRREMNLLYRDFEENAVSTEEQKNIVAKLKSYNSAFSDHKRSLVDTIRDAPFLLRMLLQKVQNVRNLWFVVCAMLRSGRLITAILYILSPFDLLPEAILGPIGLIDDAAMVGFVILTIANISYSLLRNLNR